MQGEAIGHSIERGPFKDHSQYLDVLSGEIEKNLYKICILYI
jgi:hypothetical protein